jgi:hypothetical protein
MGKAIRSSGVFLSVLGVPGVMTRLATILPGSLADK